MSHIQLCWLRLRMRVIENGTGDTWRKQVMNSAIRIWLLWRQKRVVSPRKAP